MKIFRQGLWSARICACTLATVVSVLLWPLVALPAATAQPESLPVLEGTVVLEGSRSGYVAVEVQRTLTLSDPFVQTARDAVVITGGGLAAGFALVDESLTGTILVGGTSEAWRPFLDDFGVPLRDLDPASTFNGLEYQIEPGTYRLYLITEGGPAQVTLRFDRSRAGPRLQPTVPVEAVVQGAPLAGTSPLQPGGVYSGGDAVISSAPLLQFSWNRFDTEVHTESLLRYCYFTGRPAGPAPYGPACASVDESNQVLVGAGIPILISDESIGTDVHLGYSGALFTDSSGEQAAEAGAGISLSAAGLVTMTDYSQMWIPLGNASSAPGRPSATVGPVGSQSGAAVGVGAPAREALAVARLPATGATEDGALVGVASLLVVLFAARVRRANA